MNKTSLKTNLTPIITIILFCLLYLSGYFQMITAAFLVLIASAIEYKKDLFKSLGFQRKRLNIKSLLVIAPLLGTTFFLFYYYIMVPSVTYITGQPIDFSVFEPYKGNLPGILNLLVFMWAAAAFGEEIVFRGYLMRQFTKFFGSSNISLVINILLFGFIFGWVHAYQGITGQIVAGITGMLLAIIFHIRKNDLWFNVAVHGFIDTVAFLFIYYGWI
ncbi:membrane protease YdiL (CAAX protease family) [Aquimarina sp. EL_43]|uniref:CPBP family intramembrane glutamic endopeptidase n=1 Tax=Aquimarina TaxID=290174 RepID=UPI00046E9655|nr:MULTISPECIES: type II CAAX endopeptidase family protein [Aquimarina]MBG6130843.1 membrane protease YdiL (CAAX protease family) [Aquimarina sp. EL_35]MBG6151010.1 membrane protease YdiL (CAAX protease family) [Aquimarina sp. EL_32]MBG6169233.1 membrane protease YdiL (CAAX protease family) [Aquimarina sp. EL_43]